MSKKTHHLRGPSGETEVWEECSREEWAATLPEDRDVLSLPGRPVPVLIRRGDMGLRPTITVTPAPTPTDTFIDRVEHNTDELMRAITRKDQESLGIAEEEWLPRGRCASLEEGEE